MKSLWSKKNLMFLIGVRSTKLYYKLVCLGLFNSSIFHRKLLKGITTKFVSQGYEMYKVYGKLHREDGPAIIIIEQYSRREEWYWNNQLHRIDEPARILTSVNGAYVKSWLMYGRYHMIGGPAYIYVSGNARVEAWYINGERHRIGAPASITMLGDICMEEKWYENGKLHRVDGPCVLKKYIDGRIRKEHWRVNGVKTK